MNLARTRIAAVIISCLAAVAPPASAQPPFRTLHRFSAPLRAGTAPLVEAPDGKMYGVMLTTSALTVGVHVVSASYGGSAGFAASNSGLHLLVINP